MIYILSGDRLKKTSSETLNINTGGPYLALYNLTELQSLGVSLGIEENIISECQRNAVKFESHDGFDFIAMNIPIDIDKRKKVQRICIYYSDNLLLFVTDNDKLIHDMLMVLDVEGMKSISLGRVLHLFFDKLTYNDVTMLENIERNITKLEEELIMAKKDDLSSEIIGHRRKLLIYKRYYEQLLEICEEMEENENDLIDQRTLRYFRMLTNRVDRLYHSVLNLRDYVTQVREAYQAQIDISLNRVMKIFTVIAAIFLPLTLITGWYGMNVNMPEYGWTYGYLFVICLSLFTLTISLLFIKRKKWF